MIFGGVNYRLERDGDFVPSLSSACFYSRLLVMGGAARLVILLFSGCLLSAFAVYALFANDGAAYFDTDCHHNRAADFEGSAKKARRLRS